MPAHIVLILIRCYQATFSPDHGFLKALFPLGFCKYSPSCSQYGYNAIEHFGLLKGIGKILWRIIRCNPWSRGGDDYI